MDVCELLNVLSYGFAGTVCAKPQLLHPYHDISNPDANFIQVFQYRFTKWLY
jgi:hypothetical protein